MIYYLINIMQSFMITNYLLVFNVYNLIWIS